MHNQRYSTNHQRCAFPSGCAKRNLNPTYLRYADSGFAVGENWFADYDLKGPIQSGQTGTYVVRLSDRDDGYKVFRIEVFKIPAGSTQDYDRTAPEAAGRI